MGFNYPLACTLIWVTVRAREVTLNCFEVDTKNNEIFHVEHVDIFHSKLILSEAPFRASRIRARN